MIHSFFHSGHFYSASSSPLPFKSAPETAQILCLSFTPKRHRQLRFKDLPKVPTWQLEWDSNPPPSGRKASTNDYTLFPLFFSNLRFFGLIWGFFPSYFDHDSFMHYALHILDTHEYTQAFAHSCSFFGRESSSSNICP